VAIKRTVTLFKTDDGRLFYLADLGDVMIQQRVGEMSLDFTRSEEIICKLCQRIMELEEKCQNL
jgi:hypothetical protein